MIAARLLLADAQLNWEEELYWQVAQAWNEGGLPYVDVFDHKAPLIYVVQLVCSDFSGSIWLLRASATLALPLSAACFGLAMWPERKDLAAAFTFLVLLALSAFGCLGANSEVLYAPYVLLTGAFLLRGSVLSAALAAAVAVNIKYPVGLDVIGVARFLIVAASLGVWGLLSGARLDRSARGGPSRSGSVLVAASGHHRNDLLPLLHTGLPSAIGTSRQPLADGPACALAQGQRDARRRLGARDTR